AAPASYSLPWFLLRASAAPATRDRVPWLVSCSSDFDRAWLFQFRARYEEREHAIAVLGAYSVRVYLDRNRDRAVEDATNAFTPMDAGIFLVFDLFLASDAYRVFLCFDG